MDLESDEIKNRLKAKISTSPDEAIIMLENLISKNGNSNKYNEFISLKARFGKLQKEIDGGLISFEEHNIEYNKLIRSLLRFIDSVGFSEVNNDKEEKPIPLIQKIIIPLVLVLILIAAAVYYSYDPPNKELSTQDSKAQKNVTTYYKSGHIKFKGKERNDGHGFGTMYYLLDSNTKGIPKDFDGFHSNDGFLICTGCKTYIGEVYNGYKEGMGTYYNESGAAWRGNFKDDNLIGRCFYKNGSLYQDCDCFGLAKSNCVNISKQVFELGIEILKNK